MKFRIFKTLIYIYNDLPGNFLRSFFIIMIQETYHWACSQFLHCPLGNFFIDKLTACLTHAREHLKLDYLIIIDKSFITTKGTSFAVKN